jgi:hypothetical protein
MDAKKQMIEILRSDETRRIRFSFRGTSGATISVDQSSFRRVADALQSGAISVVEGRFNTDTAMYSARADAATNVAANTFYLGRHHRFSRLFNALIVHESVHASFDLTRSSLPWIDNEAAAYIAQAYYARNSGLPRLAFQFGSEAIIAYSVVQNMRAGDTEYVDFFLGALRDSLHASPQYHGYIRGTFTGDG